MGYISSNPHSHKGPVVSSDLYTWRVIQIKRDMKAGSRPRHVGFCTSSQGQFKDLKTLGTVLIERFWKINPFQNQQQERVKNVCVHKLTFYHVCILTDSHALLISLC